MKKETANFIRGVVTKRGKHYKPALLPAGIKRGRPGDCFDWCMIQAMQHPEYRYVEGLAQDPDDLENFVYHAWLTDGKHAFDPTWMAIDNNGKEREMPIMYLGIELDMMEVAKFVSATEYKAVLANHWRAPELSKPMIERFIPV